MKRSKTKESNTKELYKRVRSDEGTDQDIRPGCSQTQEGSSGMDKSKERPIESLHTVVIVDLETTGLITHDQFPHITQIAAVEVESGMTFDTYVIPKIPISPEAQQLTGISCDNQHTCMFVNNSQVASSNITNALKSFCKWLKKFQNVIIVAHNGREFDFPILLSAADNTGMLDRLTSRVTWCLDSLELFRKVYPRRRSHKQKDLVTDLLGQRYDAHDALADSRLLCDLFKLVSVPVERYMDLVFPIEEAQ